MQVKATNTDMHNFSGCFMLSHFPQCICWHKGKVGAAPWQFPYLGEPTELENCRISTTWYHLIRSV